MISSGSNMKPVFFGHQFVNSLLVHVVWYAAVYRANRSTLRLFVETLALCAFIGNDVVSIYADRGILGVRIDDGTVQQGEISLDGSTISDCPFHATFINGIIWTLGLAGTAVYTFFCDLDSHTFNGFFRGSIRI
jgi:hypothetical protein